MRLAAAIAVLAACALAVVAPPDAAAARAGVTRIVSPTANQVVGNGGVQVVVRSSARLGRLRFLVDGRDVKRYFGGSGGIYRATLRPGRGLHLGVDELLVVTGAGAEVDDVSFIVAQRVNRLLRLSRLQVGGREAPVRAVAQVARGATLQAWVNGHRDDGAFQPGAGGYVGRLGASDWLRPGKNRLFLLAHTTSPSGRYAAYDSVAATFQRRPGLLTASAGRDLIAKAGDFIRLRGSASDAGDRNPTPPRVSYRWRITGRPAGAVAKLYDRKTSTPEFEADAPGQYLVSAKVIGAGGASSVDTTTVTVQADLPPIGAPFQSAADDRGTIELNGEPVANTTEPCDPGPDGLNCGGFGSYAVFNRVTLQLVTSGVFRPDKASGTDSMQTVADLADTYNTPPTYLMIVNFGPVGGDGNALAAGRRLVRTLGVNPMSDADMNYMLRNAFPKSIIGVPGSPAGSAFLSDPDLNRSSYHGRHAANMAGYLRLNPLSTTGTFEFVFTDQVEFDTDISQTPSVVTMRVGDQTYSRNVEGGVGGLSGFVLVELNSQTLAVQQTSVNFTNRPDGEQEPVGAKDLARSLERASANDNKHGQLLLLLQAFGRPKGTSTAWLEAAQAIGKLGGNAQVFAQLNQGFGEEPHQGRYAFVGRSSMDMPAAVSSQSLTGKAVDGKLHGLFARGRDDQYEPVIADPTGTINFELVRLVNRPSPPGGGFPAFTPGEAAAATFLGRDRDIMGVCEAGPATCDVRKAYYEKYTPADLWPTILNRLGSDFAKRKCDEPHVGFTAAECNDVREELELEVSRRNRVAAYFGPTGLQAPFLGGVGVAALVDIADISAQIRTALSAPPTNNATATALDIIGLLTRIAGIGGLVKPPIGAIAAGVSGSFGLAGYLTRENGSPDLIGPKVTSAAASLGVDLFNRYQRASAYFTTEAKIVMSDWSKMSEVAAAVASNPKWALGDVASSVESMRLGTKQAIYQSLIPVAFPVLYDLGTGVAHAKDWRCINPVPFTVNKNLFQRTGTGSELTWTLTSPPSLGVRHLLAVGAPHTVGNVGNAFIPAPPDSITGPLFRDPASPQGGIGLYKLDLYSPQRFRVFPEVLQQTTHGLGFGFYTCAKLPDPPGNSG